MAVPPTTAAFCLAAILAAAGCAGGPGLTRAVTVVEDQRTTVRLVRFDGDSRAFTLVNHSSARSHEVYSGEGQLDALTKVVPDAQLQTLLDVFAEKGLFAGAGAGVPGEARAAIVVAQGGRRLALHGVSADVARKVAFSEAQAYFLTLYNSATAYHTADVTRQDLSAERDRHTGTRPAGGRKQ